jgi:uridine phosphorylase
MIAVHAGSTRRTWKGVLRLPAESTPLLSNKGYHEPSVFVPENLLREARRQKSLPMAIVPEICVLDPDGDIVRTLVRQQRARRESSWACYHTDLFVFEQDGFRFGIIGCAVGGPYAVLVAEELFASGCRLLVSVTSAGQIVPLRPPPYFVLIEHALRDEGTSHHYLPPTTYARVSPLLLAMMESLHGRGDFIIERGASWTTDAPFRETQQAIAYAQSQGILAVEMEAASLYAFAEARCHPVLCFAHITNQMARIEGDFEKGEADGTTQSLRLLDRVARLWLGEDGTPRDSAAQA